MVTGFLGANALLRAQSFGQSGEWCSEVCVLYFECRVARSLFEIITTAHTARPEAPRALIVIPHISTLWALLVGSRR